MYLLLELLFCGGLVWVFAQDIKQRAIHVFILPLLAGLLIGIGLGRLSLGQLITYTMINSSFVLFLLLSVLLYLRVKLREWVNPFKGYFGLGDALFWGVICLAFSPLNFIFFQVFSLLTALILHLPLSLFKGYGDQKKVPLAGLQALCLGVAFFYAKNLFYDDLLIFRFIFS